MMSKRLFCKAMAEDLRHRGWMAALAGLASFLLLPVAWMAIMSNIGKETGVDVAAETALNFYSSYFLLLGTVYTMAGALITAVGGFRFVFHKRMLDVYHALPVRRSVWYGVCYVNGFLIWLLPFLLGLGVTLVMSAGDLSARGVPGETMSDLTIIAFRTLFLLLLVFLGTYHLTLTGVMLSGNVLNALTSAEFLGCGVFVICLLCAGLLSFYMSTASEYTIRQMLFTGACFSPLASGISLMMAWSENLADEVLRFTGMERQLWASGLGALLLGVTAYLLYLRRPSELAEQGVKNRAVRAVMQLAAGVTSALFGWLFFCNITSGSPAWCVFGALFFGVLSFGVSGMIFGMEWKAFWAHKLQMAGAVAVSIGIGFAFKGDWFGYDHYLPDKEDVAQIVIESRNFANHFLYSADMLEGGGLTDKDANYAFLERMARRGVSYSYGSLRTEDVALWENLSTGGESMTVKVTLKSGRSYYRCYYVSAADKDVTWPLLTSEAYMEKSYRIPLEESAACPYLTFERSAQADRRENIPWEQARIIFQAYNRDVEEHPEAVLGGGQGRLLVKLETMVETGRGERYPYQLDVYDTMSYTVEALRQTGWADWVREVPQADIREIDLLLYQPDSLLREARQGQTGRELADAYFGTMKQEQVSAAWIEAHEVLSPDGAGNGDSDGKTSLGPVTEAMPEDSEAEPVIRARLTSREEVAQIAGLLSYILPERYNYFEPDWRPVEVFDSQGNSWHYYIRRGDMPEKYAALFGPALEEIKETIPSLPQED